MEVIGRLSKKRKRRSRQGLFLLLLGSVTKFCKRHKKLLLTICGIVVGGATVHFSGNTIQINSNNITLPAQSQESILGSKVLSSSLTEVKTNVVDDAEKKRCDLHEVKIEERLPGGRIFTTTIRTNNLSFTHTRIQHLSKSHDGPDRWGVISNSVEFSSSVARARDLYAQGKYEEALLQAESAKTILEKIIDDSECTDFFFEFGLQLDVTSLLEILAEKEFSNGNYSEAKRLAKKAIDDLPRAPDKLAALYLASDVMAEDSSWWFYSRNKIAFSNNVAKVAATCVDSYVPWQEWFEMDVKKVKQQLALWGYLYPLVFIREDDDFVVLKYSEIFGLPDDLPYPGLSRRFVLWGDYFGERWTGFGRYEPYNVSDRLRTQLLKVERMKRDGVFR